MATAGALAALDESPDGRRRVASSLRALRGLRLLDASQEDA